MITLNNLNETAATEQLGEHVVYCGKCKGTNVSNDPQDVSSSEYTAACLDCDEDMYSIELFYIDSNGDPKPITKKAA